MKRYILLLSALSVYMVGVSQSINQDKTALANFLKRMYNSIPFEGVKIVNDNNENHLVSVITLDKTKYSNESVMFRVAQVKAQSNANTFLNGATITSETIIKTTETADSAAKKVQIIETIEKIKQNASGFTQGLELYINFMNADNTRMVFIYGREMKIK